MERNSGRKMKNDCYSLFGGKSNKPEVGVSGCVTLRSVVFEGDDIDVEFIVRRRKVIFQHLPDRLRRQVVLGFKPIRYLCCQRVLPPTRRATRRAATN